MNKNPFLRRFSIVFFVLFAMNSLLGIPVGFEQNQKPVVRTDRKFLPSIFIDSAVFKLYQKGTLVGSAFNSMDEKGNYKRKFELSLAGQRVAYEMSLTPDEQGVWKQIEIINPTFGDFHVTRDGKKAAVVHKGETEIVELPEQYIMYDDYGMIFESAMLRRYDMDKRGKQTFTRFRIPESIPGKVIENEVEYVGTETREIEGKDQIFSIFKVKNLGLTSYYWTDRDFKLCLTEAPGQHVAGVREGFEALLTPVDSDPLISKPDFEVGKDTVMIPMRDGIELAADLYFPVSQGKKYPAILIRTPYKKEMNEIDGKYYAARGYVVAIQDVRGRFASKGDWEPIVNEGADGYDTIEWLAEQDWSTGKIGMVGASYLGWVQLLAAVQKPPHLVTIIPNVPPSDPFYNIPYEYGSLFLLGALWWAEIVEKEATAEISQKAFFEISDRDYEEILDHLPVVDLDKIIFGKENTYWRKWILHNSIDSYWEKGCYQTKLAGLDIPVFLQSGWFDGDGIGTKLAYLGLKESKNRFIKLILGPWGHTDQGSSSYQGHDVGEAAALDLQQLYLRWFDFWLKGIDNKIVEEPLVQMYALNSETWLKADTYPLPQTRFTQLYLSSKEGANTLKGDGKLVWEVPDKGKLYDSYVYDPGAPTPAPQFRAKDKGRKGYDDITGTRQDILVFESEPFKEPLTIAGPVSVKLYASTSAKDTDWFITFHALSDKDEIIPLGNPWGRGTIRARFRNSMSEPELLEPDKVYEYTIDLWHTGITFEKNWRIRIEVTSAFFPFFSRNLNTGGHNEVETEYIPADQRVYHCREYPSHLLLPVVDIGRNSGRKQPESEKETSVPTDERQISNTSGEMSDTDEPSALIQVNPSILISYLGEYGLRPGLTFSITSEKGKLMIRTPGESKQPLVPLSESTFLLDKVKEKLTFVQNDNGRVTHFLLFQGGYKFQVKNLDFFRPEQKNERIENKVDPHIFETYVGDYELGPNQRITISRQGESLFVQLTGQPKIKVFPASEKTFFCKGIDAEITFNTDRNGELSHLVLYQNGVFMQADKSK
ncbi:MAG: CocE/NonD family hydrolase [Candidatus Aminicenantes bacterium]|nr:CocE/NonD family hydrolase [Candidatus Aminicenantes bacterium]